VDDNGCYMDNYSYGELNDNNIHILDSSDIIQEDDDVLIKPNKGEIVNILTLGDGERIVSINSDSFEQGNRTVGVIAVNMGDKIKILPVELNNKISCSLNSNDTTEYSITPAIINNIDDIKNNTRTYSVYINGEQQNNITNVCIKNMDYSYEVYCHINGIIYKTTIDVNDISINYTNDNIVLNYTDNPGLELVELIQSYDGSILAKYIKDDIVYFYNINTH
jgi:hypothetical protein